MSKEPKHQIHRDWDKTERVRHGQQVRERFADEREKKFSKAQEVIEEMLIHGVTISQNEVARRTGFSVGFVNQHLRSLIEKAKQRQCESGSKSRTIRQFSAEIKELERLRAQNSHVREQLEEQRRANKALLAQVAQVVDLEDTVELLRVQVRELQAALQASQEKVVNFPRPSTSTEIEDEVERTGVKLNSTLRRELGQHSSEAVLKAIRAFEQYRSKHEVQNLSACLMQAIKEEWEPNDLNKEYLSQDERELNQPSNISQVPGAIKAEDFDLESLLPEAQKTSNPELIEKISHFYEQIKSLAGDHEKLKEKNKELKAQAMGVESLELENEKLKKHNQHLMKLLSQSEGKERSKAALDFAKERQKAEGQPEIPDIEF